MRILYFLDNVMSWKSGIWYHRTEIPGRGLSKRGHSIRQVAIGANIPDEFMEYPDVVVMGRIYPEHTDPLKTMKAYIKQGTKVVYDIDDDYWAVDPSNPSRFVSNVFKNQYESLIKEADVITTPSKVLANKIRKMVGKKKPIFICHNAIDFDDYVERPRKNKELVIGYMGAASHWRDLAMIMPALEKLNEKHDFIFAIHGIVGGDFDSEIHTYNRLLSQNVYPEQNDYYREAINFYEKMKGLKMAHKPFVLPELHPIKLSESDFDIGLAPLEDNEFSRGKSCIKYYEYAAVGTPCIASNVEPYKSEVNYLAKNTTEDWYKKIEKLIVDEKFRNELAKKQQEWVKENRSLDKIAIDWELALQKDNGKKSPKVLNQDKKWLKKFQERWQKK